MTDTTELAQSLKAAADREMICRDGAETSEIWERNVTPENILALVEALEKAQQRITQLESRTVKLPEPYAYLRENDGQIQISIGAERPSDRSGGYSTPWFAIYTAAGLKVKAE
ncbi:hypothetical protein MBO75_004630 [Klebsiella pneumoniae]|nr:hypothetical protein [Klebsiella pneumoniae]